ncbi:MAG: hypothetical protein ACOVRP_14345 [Gemmatimonas sp.]|jgi:hypothetical protein
MTQLRVCYPGAFLLTFGQHRFEVYLGEALVKASPGYRRSWEALVDAAPGNQQLEVRAINRWTGFRRSTFFTVQVPHAGSHRLLLGLSHAWGSWREPVIVPVTTADECVPVPASVR